MKIKHFVFNKFTTLIRIVQHLVKVSPGGSSSTGTVVTGCIGVCELERMRDLESSDGDKRSVFLHLHVPQLAPSLNIVCDSTVLFRFALRSEVNLNQIAVIHWFAGDSGFVTNSLSRNIIVFREMSGTMKPSVSTLFDLKAELHKRKELLAKKKDSNRYNASDLYVKGKPILAERHRLMKEANTSKAAKKNLSDPEIFERERQLMQSKQKLQEKAALYEQLKAGIKKVNNYFKQRIYMGGTMTSYYSMLYLLCFLIYNLDEPDIYNETTYLVNFEQKDKLQSSSDSEVSDEESSLSSKKSFEASKLGDEWVEYTDFAGRNRVCLKKDLPKMKAIDDKNSLRSQHGVSWNSETELMSKDMKRELQRQKWENEVTSSTGAAPVHYQHVLGNGLSVVVVFFVGYIILRLLLAEPIVHGASYYEFSLDEQKRQEQMKMLDEARQQTLIHRAKNERIREKRKLLLKARLEKVAERRQIGSFPELFPNMTEDEKNVDDIPMPDDTPDEQKAEDEERAKRRAIHVRPWDEIKKKRTSWIEERREERDPEFAPPKSYYPAHFLGWISVAYGQITTEICLVKVMMKCSCEKILFSWAVSLYRWPAYPLEHRTEENAPKMDEETSKQRKGYSFAELLELSHLYRVEVDLRDWYFRTHYLTFRSFTERLDHQDAIDHLPKLENSPHLLNDRIFRLYSFGFLERELGSRLLYTDIMVDRNCKLRSVGPPFWKTLCNTYVRIVRRHPPTDDSREHIIQYPLDFNMCKFSRHVASNSFYYSQESRLMRLVDEVPLDKRRIQCLVNIDPLVPENITVCPGNERLFAFVADRNVHVSTGAVPVTLEHSSSRQSWSYGLPPYIIREEFNRHEGFWWSPTSNGNEYFLLVEGYNDKMLPSIVLSDCTMSPDKFECLRYAFAGGPNPKWCVKVYSVIFKYRASFPDVEVWERNFPERLIKLVPWAEYLVNAGWLPDGSAIWLKVMDRLQRRVSVICIPLEWFLPNDCADNNDVRKADAQKHLVFLYTEESDTWIPNHFGIKFLTPVSPDTVRFIWCSWKTDYRHLYLVESRRTASVEENFDTPTLDITPTVLSEKQLTFGQWDVSVDEKRSLIYFLGFADNPLESHLYATSYICPTTKPIRISTLGSFYGNTDEGNPFGFSNDYTLLAVFRSNFVTPGECVIYALKFETFFSNDLKYVLPSAASHLIISVAPYPAMNGVCPLPPPGRIFHESIWSRFTSEVSPPQLLECEGPAGGYQLQCMLFTPSNVAVATPRPTILFVYGGPCAQMVRNCWPTFLCLPLFMKMGYVVLVVDGRGSAYRGKQLEIAIGGRMGCVEIEDQVHALRYVASQNKCIDMKRVVVMGWSYGGYLAINALAKHPNIFKIAISGAPVVDWHLYDSAYTERYMGMPEEHVDNYDKASLLNSISLLPDEPNRLLLMHGLKDQNVHFKHTALLIEKMISAGKPYQLKIFPNERHGLRRATAIEHMSATILHFLQENL
ncbi:Dipeptidyl peptidase 8 [Trichinella patagoniensis]|uniref:Dipeptidyl peptidase 8 n=1 Tax=Trichinella patagoniensis TaxID=990121 RepID=A0A0V0Z9R9_9BILA|nr:Dipeptidyl peptidase 8 [Trichinella patagoniensis]